MCITWGRKGDYIEPDHTENEKKKPYYGFIFGILAIILNPILFFLIIDNALFCSSVGIFSGIFTLLAIILGVKKDKSKLDDIGLWLGITSIIFWIAFFVLAIATSA